MACFITTCLFSNNLNKSQTFEYLTISSNELCKIQSSLCVCEWFEKLSAKVDNKKKLKLTGSFVLLEKLLPVGRSLHRVILLGHPVVPQQPPAVPLHINTARYEAGRGWLQRRPYLGLVLEHYTGDILSHHYRWRDIHQETHNVWNWRIYQWRY